MESYVLGLAIGILLLNLVFLNTVIWRKTSYEKD